MSPPFAVGDPVRKLRHYPGGTDPMLLGRSTVARVTSTRVTLADGSVWRAGDGYLWGSRPTRGVGRHYEPRIEAVRA